MLSVLRAIAAGGACVSAGQAKSFAVGWCPTTSRKFATSRAKWNDAYRAKWGITNGPAAELPEAVTKDLLKLARNVYGWLRIRGFGQESIFVCHPGTDVVYHRGES